MACIHPVVSEPLLHVCIFHVFPVQDDDYDVTFTLDMDEDDEGQEVYMCVCHLFFFFLQDYSCVLLAVICPLQPQSYTPYPVYTHTHISRCTCITPGF